MRRVSESPCFLEEAGGVGALKLQRMRPKNHSLSLKLGRDRREAVKWGKTGKAGR